MRCGGGEDIKLCFWVFSEVKEVSLLHGCNLQTGLQSHRTGDSARAASALGPSVTSENLPVCPWIMVCQVFLLEMLSGGTPHALS